MLDTPDTLKHALARLALQKDSGAGLGSFEKLGKASTFVVIAVTVCGYIVMSLFEARFGYVSPSPLKPRVISAGMLFAFFSVAPVAIGWLLSAERILGSSRAAFWEGVSLKSFAVTMLGSITLTVFDLFLVRVSDKDGIHALLRAGGAALILPLIFVLTRKSFKLHEGLLGAVAIFSTILLFCYQLYVAYGSRAHRIFFVWTFGLVVVGLISDTLFEEINWRGRFVTVIGFPFFLVTLFANLIFPVIDSGWGGGKPARVELLLSKDSFAPNLHVQKLLLDETDSGFYVSDSPSAPTQFISRGQVSLLSYLDR